MTYYLDHTTDIVSWDELQFLPTPWAGVYDLPRSVLLLRGDDAIALSEEPGAWRARQRRALHQLGFRPRTRPHCTMWEWAPPEDAVQAEVGKVFTRPASTPGIRWLYADLARGRLLDARCVVVLRDVFALTPADLHLAVLVEDAEEGDDAI